MSRARNPNPKEQDPALARILRLLIPAIILFIEVVLAQSGNPESPAMRRMARTLHALRELAALSGIAIPGRLPARRDRVARPPAYRLESVHPGLWSPIPGPTPQCARTLEL